MLVALPDLGGVDRDIGYDLIPSRNEAKAFISAYENLQCYKKRLLPREPAGYEPCVTR